MGRVCRTREEETPLEVGEMVVEAGCGRFDKAVEVNVAAIRLTN